MHHKQKRIWGAISLLLFSSLTTAEIPPEERRALIAFYHATEGDNWKEKTNWLGKIGTECTWLGILCSEDNHVKQIRLANNNLKGTLPPELAGLSQLTHARLGHNALKGKIPISILSQLPNLQRFDLDSNQLEGEIPPSISQLTQLTGIRLGNNLLTGHIPKELGQLSQLRVLGLNNNQLEGEIPKELGALNLTILYLPYNQLSGEIPAEIGQIKGLNALVLDHNQLTGSVLDKLPNIPDMMRFQVHNNCLSIDSEFDQFPKNFKEVHGLDLGNQNECNGQANTPLIETGYSYNIEIPMIQINGKAYKVMLEKPGRGLGPLPWVWKVGEIEEVALNPENTFAVFDAEAETIIFDKINYRTQTLQVMLHRYQHPEGKEGIYFQYLPYIK